MTLAGIVESGVLLILWLTMTTFSLRPWPAVPGMPYLTPPPGSGLPYVFLFLGPVASQADGESASVSAHDRASTASAPCRLPVSGRSESRGRAKSQQGGKDPATRRTCERFLDNRPGTAPGKPCLGLQDH